MKKRGVLITILTVLISFLNFIIPAFKVHAISFYYGYGEWYAIRSLVESLWFNAILIILLIFAILLYSLSKFFDRRTAAIISFIISLMAGLSIVYFYGPILAEMNIWAIALFIAIVGLLLLIALKLKNICIIPPVIIAFWLIFRNKLCGSLIEYGTCKVIDYIVIALGLILILCILHWLSKKMPEKGPITPPQFKVLTIRTEGNGTTNPEPGSYNYVINSKAKVRAIPRGDNRFVGWWLDNKYMGGSQEVEITMNEDHDLLAKFEGPGKYILEIRVVGKGGTTRPGPGKYEFREGEKVVVEEIHEKNIVFDGWMLDNRMIGKDKKVKVIMDKDHLLIAHFRKIEEAKLILEIVKGEGAINLDGRKNVLEGKAKKDTEMLVPIDSIHTIEAVPAEGYEFEGWQIIKGSVKSYDINPIRVKVDLPVVTVRVLFKKPRGPTEYAKMYVKVGEQEVVPGDNSTKINFGEERKIIIENIGTGGKIFWKVIKKSDNLIVKPIKSKGIPKGEKEEIEIQIDKNKTISAIYNELNKYINEWIYTFIELHRKRGKPITEEEIENIEKFINTKELKEYLRMIVIGKVTFEGGAASKLEGKHRGWHRYDINFYLKDESIDKFILNLVKYIKKILIKYLER